MSGAPSSGFDLSPWMAANAALAARISAGRSRGIGLPASGFWMLHHPSLGRRSRVTATRNGVAGSRRLGPVADASQRALLLGSVE